MDIKVEKSFWRKGKDDYRTFCEAKLKKSTNIISIFFGLLVAAIIILPVAIFGFQFVELYWFNNPDAMFLFLAFAFALFMIANGLSNYVTIKMVKLYEIEMKNIQELNCGAVFFYQFLNPWFALFILLILIFFAISSGVI